MKTDFRPPDLCSITILSFLFTGTLVQMKDYVKTLCLGGRNLNTSVYMGKKTSGICANI